MTNGIDAVPEERPPTDKLKIDIPILLPEVEGECDQCVKRLKDWLSGRKGIEYVHLHQGGGAPQLCLHYYTDVISLAQIQRLAEQAGVQITERYRHEVMRIEGMDCTDCSLTVEHSVARLDGVLSVSVNYAAQRMRVEYDSWAIQRADIIKRIHGTGYLVVEEERERSCVQENWELVLSLLSGLFLIVGWTGETFLDLQPGVATSLYALAYLAGGFNTVRYGVTAITHGHFDIDVLMTIAAVGAAVLGNWAEGALLLFLFSMGHALEEYATGRARNAIRALANLSPKTARVRRDREEIEVPADDVWLDDIAIVRPGERIPVDGDIVQGHSSVDQSPITGESMPVDKAPGQPVFAGSINGVGALEVRVTKLAQDTTLARVAQMVKEAQTQKSPLLRFTERLEWILVPAVLVGIVLLIVMPPLAGWLSWSESFMRGMTILVATSPCALAIATPSAILASVAQAARNGVLVKGGAHLENLGTLEVIAFDKTGTITQGRPRVTDLIPFNRTNENELLRVAAAVETRSGHPLAQEIVRDAESRGLELPKVGELENLIGRGVHSSLGGQPVFIGNLKLFDEAGFAMPDEVRECVLDLEIEGKTAIVVGHGTQLLGIIALADIPRSNSKTTISALKQLGIKKTVMLTGDNERVAAAIAHQVGISEYRADLLPEDKVATIKELMARYGKVAMIGDGVNDAPALANSTVGIAMGGAGSDVALETADVALMADDLSKLPFVVALSRQTRRIIHQNLWISLGVIALLIPTALFGLAGIGIAILFHEGSTLVVVANALRLLRFRLS